MHERTLNYTSLCDKEKYKDLYAYLQQCMLAHFSEASSRFEGWAALDRSLKALKKRRKTSGKGENERLDETGSGLGYVDDINIPLGYFILDTLEAQFHEIFFERDTIWSLTAVNSEERPLVDKFDAKLRAMGKLFNHSVELKNAIHCALKYNQAWVSPSWKRKHQKRYERDSQGRKKEKDVIRMEGVELTNISPYRMILDPMVPPDKVNDMRFIGSWKPWSRNDIHRAYGVPMEKLEAFEWMWAPLSDLRGFYGSLFTATRLDNFITTVADLYADIVPCEVGLGEGREPEVWHFVLAGYDVILKAEPANVIVGKYPYFSLVPTGDGADTRPVGIMELIKDMIAIYNWLYSSRMAAVRQDLSGDYVINERLVRVEDLENRDPYRGGNVIRLARAAWMVPNAMQQAIQRLQFSHDTKDYSRDAAQLFENIKIISGVYDALSGVYDSPSSRRTAEEISRVVTNASKRIKKLAGRMRDTWLKPLGEAIVVYTQALSEAQVRVQGNDGRWYDVDWSELLVPVEINVGDGFIMQDPQSLAQSWQLLLEFIRMNPELSMVFKKVKMLEELGRVIGIPNLRDYLSSDGIAAYTAMVAEQAAGAGAGATGIGTAEMAPTAIGGIGGTPTGF